MDLLRGIVLVLLLCASSAAEGSPFWSPLFQRHLADAGDARRPSASEDETVGRTVLPPNMPEQFSTTFTEFTAPLTGPPPYLNGVPQAPFWASRGTTYYDWTHRRMIEVRTDYCVNIWNFSNMFPCTFHNINGISYLISFNTSELPPCCVFGQPWYPPPPGFLRHNVTTVLERRAPWDGRPADWFENPLIPPPIGPFWFAFRNATTSPQLYKCFSFPGSQGWSQQNFDDPVIGPPPEHVWDLPPQCLPADKVPNCPN